MIKEVPEIQNWLIDTLRQQTPSLRITKDTDAAFEVTGTVPCMQGKAKVDGMYFGSVMPKTKDCRLYFFPIYTDPEKFSDLAEPVRKYLKVKSCFHVKNVTDENKAEIERMIALGVDIYKEKGLL